jgi:hypothetical protein
MVFRVEPRRRARAWGAVRRRLRAALGGRIVYFGMGAARQGLTVAEAGNVLGAGGSGPAGVSLGRLQNSNPQGVDGGLVRMIWTHSSRRRRQGG